MEDVLSATLSKWRELGCRVELPHVAPSHGSVTRGPRRTSKKPQRGSLSSLGRLIAKDTDEAPHMTKEVVAALRREALEVAAETV